MQHDSVDDRQAFRQAFTRLAVGTRAHIDDAMMLTYFEEMLDLDLPSIEAAVSPLLRNCKFFPSVSEWRAAAEEEGFRLVEDRALLTAGAVDPNAGPSCQICDDTGFAPYEHPDRPGSTYVRPCACAGSNPIILARRAAERRAGRGKR
jgi:hypothetical protein